MRTEKEILDILAVFVARKKHFEEQQNREQNPNLPDAIEESACKIQALEWVLGYVEDIFTYPLTLKSLNAELRCANLLKEINQEKESEQ